MGFFVPGNPSFLSIGCVAHFGTSLVTHPYSYAVFTTGIYRIR